MTLSLQNLTIIKNEDRKETETPLFSHLNLTIQAGGVLSLMGPSGCGKSTLLDAIAGHLSEQFTLSGHIVLNGKTINSIDAHNRKVGILFQDDLLFPHLNVWENLAFALPNSVKKSDRKEKAMSALDSISLHHLSEHYPKQLSGGQRARISLIRMLLAEPEMALLDEPFSKLDKELRTQFRDWVFEQLKKANIPTLMVTHDLDDIPPHSSLVTWPWKEMHNA
ncbi:ATP-binding cassette domain-containing protein [Vibrio sp.]|nr:ATP-binding cassette domain-containing protein [Vibrio sp.]